MGQNSLWEVQYGGISLFSGEVAPQDGVFFICCIFPLQIWGIFFNTNAVWGKALCGLCSMGESSFFLILSDHKGLLFTGELFCLCSLVQKGGQKNYDFKVCRWVH
jgi:hypothetical protein